MGCRPAQQEPIHTAEPDFGAIPIAGVDEGCVTRQLLHTGFTRPTANRQPPTAESAPPRAYRAFANPSSPSRAAMSCADEAGFTDLSM